MLWKICIYSFHKGKNVFGTMFQITFFSVWNISCVFGMRVYFCLKSVWPLLFPYVPLKLLLFPKFSKNCGTKQAAMFSFASFSSSPSTQTMIEGWASVFVVSRPFMLVIHPTPVIARGFIAAKPKGRRFHFTTENPWACCKSWFEEHFELGS